VTSVTIVRDGGTNNYTVGSGQSVTVENTVIDNSGNDFELNFGSTATSASFTLNKVTSAGTNSEFEIVGAALTSATITTTGAASSIDNLDLAGAGSLATLNIKGDQDLTIVDALATTVTKVDASSLTGKLSVVGADIAQTVNGGSNDDTVDLRAESTAKTMTVSLGAGNDTLKLTAIDANSTNYTADDVLAGGDGTDTLTLAIANAATFNTNVSAKTTGFEVLEVVTDAGATKSATLDVGATGLGVTSLKASATAAADTINFSGVQAASTITVAADVAVLSAALQTATGTADVLSLALGGTAGGIDVGTSFTAAAIETINIASTGATTKNTIASLVTEAAKSVVVTGSGKGLDLTLTDIVAGTTTFDAAGYSGALTLVATAEALKSVTAGSGDDTVTVGAGTLAQGFTAAGGAGTDKLVATATAGQNLGILAVSAFETIELSSNATAGDTVTADFRNVTGLNTLKLTAGDNTDIFVLNNFGTATIAADNDTVGAINIQSTQTSTSLKLGGAGNTIVTTLTMDAGATTLNVESASGTSTITNIAGTSLTTINVTGAGATVLDTTLASTVTTINAAAATGAVTATLGGAGTLTGGSAGDTLGGSAGKDTINAGAGSDTVTGGAGADAINVGTGTDTVVQGVNDSGDFTTPAGNSVSTTGFDVVTGLAAADFLDLAAGDYTISTATSLAGIAIANLQSVLVRGTYDATVGTFVGSATGTDTLFVYDANGLIAGVDAEAIVLVGFVGTATDDGANGVFTLA